MNICFINTEYPSPRDHGGIGRYVYNAANCFAGAGHSVWLLDKANSPREALHHSVTYISYSRRAFLRFPLSFLCYRLFYKGTLHLEYARGLAHTVASVFRECGNNLAVEVPDYLGEGVFLRKYSIPYITKLHTPTFLLDRMNHTASIFTYFLRILEKRSILRSRMLVSPSRSLAGIIRRYYGIRHDIPVIPYPVGSTVPDPDTGDRRNSVLFVGREETRKGAHLLAPLAKLVHAQMPACTIEAAGNFNEKNGTVRDGISYLGPTERSSLFKRYRSASVLAFLSDWDNYPNVVMEAMLHGCIVVTFDNGGAAEMVEDGKSGFIIPDRSLAAMADRIVRILQNPSDFSTIREATVARISALGAHDRFLKTTVAQYT